MNCDAMVYTMRYLSPCGELVLGGLGDRLCLCDWQGDDRRNSVGSRLCRLLEAEFAPGASAVTDMAARQLDEYFAGARRAFDVPLLFAGTPFQQAVWQHLLGIPYGETISYGDMASRLGCPKAVRAVANAIGANAMSVFVPCHRVVGSGHALTGYAGGLDAKRWLLLHEGARGLLV